MTYEITESGKIIKSSELYWRLTFADINANFIEYGFKSNQFKLLIDKIDELTYSKGHIYVLHREEMGKDPFITKSANLLVWYIENAPLWGSRGHYHLFCYDNWEEAYDNAFLLQERYENCYKK